jgi:geranylgeranyl pyrophosphate synthase
VTELDMLTRIHSLKTGALIRAACILGGLAAEAGPGDIAALSLYGTNVGLAFQLADDVLDAHEDAGVDGPPNYVKLLGIDETRRRATAAADSAIKALTGLKRTDALIALAQFTVQRDH